MKLLGLDVGTKRIGVARADSSVRIAVPQCTVSVDGTEFEQISRISRVYNAKFFVIGLPRNAQGEETAQSRYSRDFAKKLKKAIPDAKICFQDESLTSVEAENLLKNRKKGFKKGDVDAEAATLILQDFLENFNNNVQENSSSSKSANFFKKQQAKIKARFTRNTIIVVAAIILSAGFVSFLACCIFNGSLAPVAPNVDCSTEELISKNPEACKERSVVINEGMSLAEIAASLKERDLIQSPLSFRLYAKFNGLGAGLKAGRYDLNKTMSVQEIVALLSDGSAGVVTFRITTLPGGTLSDFRKTLRDNGYSEEEIETALNAQYDHPVLTSKPTDASLEGYIYGETVEFTQGDSVETIINGMLDEMYNVVIANDLEAKFSAQGLTLHEGIIMASIIQKETVKDMPTVASVFYNRYHSGMSLGSDATVSYAVNLVDPDRQVYTDNAIALTIDSCYNTRLYAGLPCGPIASPGISALRAAAEPAETSYLYFLTGDDGMVYYSDTDSGHQINIRDHCQTLCNISL